MNTTPITQEAFDAAFKDRDAFRFHQADCQRIAIVAKREFSIQMSPRQAECIWEEYSESRCAGWLIIDEGQYGDEQIMRVIQRFVENKA